MCQNLEEDERSKEGFLQDERKQYVYIMTVMMQ